YAMQYRVLPLVAVAWGIFGGLAHADGLVFQLLTDGTWARYAVKTDGEFGGIKATGVRASASAAAIPVQLDSKHSGRNRLRRRKQSPSDAVSSSSPVSLRGTGDSRGSLTDTQPGRLPRREARRPSRARISPPLRPGRRLSMS